MISIVHMCGHHFTNVADKFISESVRKTFESKMGAIKWMDYDIRNVCTESDVDEFNQYDAVVIGGGGFILPSSFQAKKETGWVIGIPTPLIDTIKVPIIGFSVGDNLFRGEVLDDPVFVENFAKLMEHSCFFSLRHHGDIAKIKKCVPGDYDMRLNFCSSLFCREFRKQHGEVIAFQLAWDRTENRFGSIEKMQDFTDNITEVARHFCDQNRRIAVVSHTNSDRDRNSALAEEWNDMGIQCELVDLIGKAPDTLANFYYDVETTFTMRGHGQMIPMGLGCNVVSLISHDKVQYLLEDLDILDTGVEVCVADFVEKCLVAYKQASLTDFKSKLKIAKENIDENMETISELIRK